MGTGTGTGTTSGANAFIAGGAGIGAPLITGRGVADSPEMHAVNDTSDTTNTSDTSARNIGRRRNRAMNSSDMQGSRNATETQPKRNRYATVTQPQRNRKFSR